MLEIPGHLLLFYQIKAAIGLQQGTKKVLFKSCVCFVLLVIKALMGLPSLTFGGTIH